MHSRKHARMAVVGTVAIVAIVVTFAIIVAAAVAVVVVMMDVAVMAAVVVVAAAGAVATPDVSPPSPRRWCPRLHQRLCQGHEPDCGSMRVG